MEGATGLLEAVQNSGLATALRFSGIAYLLVNAAHITGIALLFGSIAALDLRLIGLFSSLPAGSLIRLLVPVAIIGLILAIATGALLFSVRAVEYAGFSIFWVKLALIAVGIANALLLRRSAAWTQALSQAEGKLSLRVAAAGALSILLWLSAIVCGRLIAYFS